LALGKDRSFLGPATDRRSIERREAFIADLCARHRAGRAHTDALATVPERRTSLADIRLFQLQSDSARELRAESVDIEKSLQALMEQHLESFLGVRFLATEYVTGKAHGGRIDTLGLDDNNCPVIIEYKRALNENVINQGLFYLDWLMDHQGEFTLQVLNAVDPGAGDDIWLTASLKTSGEV
jgi:hypothetical protein